MSKSNQIIRQWLPLAIVPVISIAGLSGCSSDNDNGNGNTNPSAVVGDAGGIAGVPDAFEAATTMGDDLNTDGIDDRYAVTGDDSNTNNVDDMFEASLTMGTDDNQDGIDDAAAAVLAATVGGDNMGTDNPDNTGDPGNPGTAESLGPLILKDNQGTVDLTWNGEVLSGTVTVDDSVGATSAALYRGIAASEDTGTSLLQLNGTAPNFDFPNGLSADQTAPVKEAMASGNLFIQVEGANGAIRSEQMLPPGGAVVPMYVNLTSSFGAVSNAAAFLNVNSTTGDYAAYINVNLNPSDVDTAGNPVTVNAAHIHKSAASGEMIIPLTDKGNGLEYSATGIMTMENLDVIKTNNGWFNVHQNDGNSPGASFLSGQIRYLQ